MDRSFVCVKWIDAESSSGWVDTSEVKEAELPVVHSVGWIIRDDNNIVAVAQTIGGDDICGVMYIPRSMVKETLVLSDPRDDRSETETTI